LCTWYFFTHYQFTRDETVLDYMKDRSDYQESKIRAVLHSMDLEGNDLKKDVRNLSGGGNPASFRFLKKRLDW